jgi:Cysteine-rich secretory protein family
MPVILPEVPKVEAAIIEMTNAVRAQSKLGAVAINPQLTTAARAYAQLLAASGKFSHDADGDLQSRTERAGYKHCKVSENLASHQDSRGFESRALAKSVVEGWLNSPGHRANLLDGTTNEIGIAVIRTPDRDPKYISVQLFGQPLAQALTFQVSNSANEAVNYVFAGKTHDLKPHMAVTHQSCQPGELAFEKKGLKPLAARFTAADGKSYVVSPTGSGSLKVDVSERLTVK